MNWRIISSQAVWLEIEQVGQHDPMNKSNLRPTATLLAGILFKIARQGYEAELKPNLYHMDLILEHIRPLPHEIVVTLRENCFEYCFLDSLTYTDADGTVRSRSHFRRTL